LSLSSPIPAAENTNALAVSASAADFFSHAVAIDRTSRKINSVEYRFPTFPSLILYELV
jgi:hypothetical protein